MVTTCLKAKFRARFSVSTSYYLAMVFTIRSIVYAEQDCNIKLYPNKITEAGERHFNNNVHLTII